MQKQKKPQQTFLLLSLIFVILLISFFSYQRLSGQAITDRSGTRTASSLPSLSQQEDNTESALLATSTIAGDLPDVVCDVTLNIQGLLDGGKCPHSESITCGIHGQLPGMKCTAGGIADKKKELCDKVKSDISEKCLEVAKRCKELIATHAPNFKCVEPAYVTTIPPSDTNSQCTDTQTFVPKRDRRGNILLNPDGTQRGTIIDVAYLSCEGTCRFTCPEAEV